MPKFTATRKQFLDWLETVEDDTIFNQESSNECILSRFMGIEVLWLEGRADGQVDRADLAPYQRRRLIENEMPRWARNLSRSRRGAPNGLQRLTAKEAKLYMDGGD